MTVPEGSGPLSLEVERAPEGPVVYLPSNSLRGIGEPIAGWRASLRVACELLVAGALAAALWPTLRRRLSAPLAAGALGTLWLWAFLGGVHAASLPSGLWPTQLDELRGALAPAVGWTRLSVGALAAFGVLAFDTHRDHAAGAELAQ